MSYRFRVICLATAMASAFAVPSTLYGQIFNGQPQAVVLISDLAKSTTALGGLPDRRYRAVRFRQNELLRRSYPTDILAPTQWQDLWR